MAQSTMSTEQALTLAVLTLEFEAENAHTAGNGVWRYEATEAAKRLQEILSNNNTTGAIKMTDITIKVERDINTIEAKTDRLKALPAELFTLQRAIDNDKIYSDEVKEARRKTLAQWGENEKQAALREVWGDWDSKTGTWAGGIAERAKTTITQHIAELKEQAANDDMDAGRISLAIREVESLAATANSIDELIAIYDNATKYQKRALQTIGGKLLADRFPRDHRAVSTAKRWQADLEAARTTPELIAAMATEGRLKFAFNRAAGVTSRIAYRDFDNESGYPYRASQFHKSQNFGPGPKATVF